jgi:hypothetical protein
LKQVGPSGRLLINVKGSFGRDCIASIYLYLILQVALAKQQSCDGGLIRHSDVW